MMIRTLISSRSSSSGDNEPLERVSRTHCDLAAEAAITY